jgi:hypothetical protein
MKTKSEDESVCEVLLGLMFRWLVTVEQAVT